MLSELGSRLGVLLQRLRGNSAGSVVAEAGVSAALDGDAAVGLVDALVGATRSPHLGVALGRALVGERASVVLDGTSVDPAMLASAAGRAVPLLAHLPLRARSTHAAATGGGHEAWHDVAGIGWVRLFARHVQDAVDLSLVGRRIAERAMVPVVIATDGPETWDSVQDLVLPSADLAARYLGAGEDTLPAVTDAQRILFGENRARVPRWFDPDHPVAQGGAQDPAAWAAGAAARDAYLSAAVPAVIADAFAEWTRLSGRPLGPLVAARTGAPVLVLAQGFAAGTAQVVTESTRQVEFAALLCCEPIDERAIVATLSGRKAVIVLERVASPPDRDPPLLREIRAILARAAESARAPRDGRPPHAAPKALPSLHTALYGLGGDTLRPQDLAAFAREVGQGGRPRVLLGVDFGTATSHYPRRQALFDELHRDYPDALDTGLRTDEIFQGGPGDAHTLAVLNRGEPVVEGLAARAAALIHAAYGGSLRSGTIRDAWARNGSSRSPGLPEPCPAPTPRPRSWWPQIRPRWAQAPWTAWHPAVPSCCARPCRPARPGRTFPRRAG